MNEDLSFLVAIIGLGDVGLPLAVAFGKQRPVIGVDIHQARVADIAEDAP